MNLRRITASCALVALLLGTTTVPALAASGERYTIAEAFVDMDGFDWGLSQVVKLQVKGVFHGRSADQFAPGAKITRQEAAVAALRLMGEADTAPALTAAEIDSLLMHMPDQAEIALWARPAVARLVSLDVIGGADPFLPQAEATRLDTAVLLARAMGLQAEATLRMTEALPFRDAHLIPEDLTGYVAAAVAHQVIKGYVDGDSVVFRPHQAVTRIEMAVMMGRADRQIERLRQDELRGRIEAVHASANALTVHARGRSMTFTLAHDGAVFVNETASSLPHLTVGMKVEIKLNAEGKMIYIEARGDEAQEQTVEGAITALQGAAATSVPAISIDGSVYSISHTATLTLNGLAATLADLQVGDTVTATVLSGMILRLEATRAVQAEVIDGGIVALAPATETSPARITVGYLSGGAFVMRAFYLSAKTQILVNGQPATFADLQTNKNVRLTLVNEELAKVEMAR